MFLFQDLQLSGCDGLVCIAGIVLLPLRHHCCQPALSFYSPMIWGAWLLCDRLTKCCSQVTFFVFWWSTQHASIFLLCCRFQSNASVREPASTISRPSKGQFFQSKAIYFGGRYSIFLNEHIKGISNPVDSIRSTLSKFHEFL